MDPLCKLVFHIRNGITSLSLVWLVLKKKKKKRKGNNLIPFPFHRFSFQEMGRIICREKKSGELIPNFTILTSNLVCYLFSFTIILSPQKSIYLSLLLLEFTLQKRSTASIAISLWSIVQTQFLIWFKSEEAHGQCLIEIDIY